MINQHTILPASLGTEKSVASTETATETETLVNLTTTPTAQNATLSSQTSRLGHAVLPTRD